MAVSSSSSSPSIALADTTASSLLACRRRVGADACLGSTKAGRACGDDLDSRRVVVLLYLTSYFTSVVTDGLPVTPIVIPRAVPMLVLKVLRPHAATVHAATGATHAPAGRGRARTRTDRDGRTGARAPACCSLAGYLPCRGIHKVVSLASRGAGMGKLWPVLVLRTLSESPHLLVHCANGHHQASIARRLGVSAKCVSCYHQARGDGKKERDRE